MEQDKDSEWVEQKFSRDEGFLKGLGLLILGSLSVALGLVFTPLILWDALHVHAWSWWFVPFPPMILVVGCISLWLRIQMARGEDRSE